MLQLGLINFVMGEDKGRLGRNNCVDQISTPTVCGQNKEYRELLWHI